jgi:hypothetical protein
VTALELVAAPDHGVQRKTDSLLARVVDHVLQLVLSFDLFVEHPKSDVFHEDYPLLPASEENFLLNDTNKEVFGGLA